MRVDFMIIGAQKCGTTSLATQLAQHPAVCFCRNKEPGYFHATEDWAAGLERYHRQYAPADGQICGEASTMYTALPEWQGTHDRLFAYNPRLKLIYIMRQPVERAVSQYAHDLLLGWAKSPPGVAVLEQPSYINRSRYSVQIRPYLELFSQDNLLLLIFEEYISYQERSLRRVAEFLGISAQPWQGISPFAANMSVGDRHVRSAGVRALIKSDAFHAIRPYIPTRVRQTIKHVFSSTLKEKPDFPPALKKTLWRFLEDDVTGIEELLGRRLELWRQGLYA